MTVITSAAFNAMTNELLDNQAVVRFCAPYCGHCKMGEPNWESLRKVYADDSHVVIDDVDLSLIHI